MQQCKSAGGLCKGAKVEPDYRVRSTEDREQRGQEYGWLGWRQRGANRPVACAKVQIRLQITAPRPYPRAEPARGMLGWHAVPTLPRYSPMPLGWHAVPTLPKATRVARGAVPTRYKVKRGTGGRKEACLLTPYSGLCNPLPPCFQRGVWSR